MTDKEIFKAMECCARLDYKNWDICKTECPYAHNCYDEEKGINASADFLDLINRQKAEIEALKGVTVQKWIPVTENPKENGIYCVMVVAHKSTKVKKRTHARYKNGKWLDLYDNWENRCWHVTHWMPLPEPPKGE